LTRDREGSSCGDLFGAGGDRHPGRRPLGSNQTSPTRLEPSFRQDRQVELAEARGIGDHVDLDDLPAPDREVEYAEQLFRNF
jgi:hypothetical protein